MTHSGGKPHAVGDRGQRYEITVFDSQKGERIVFGWAETEESAYRMGFAAIARPSWKDFEVRDRQAKQ
jgi:hypothetical protein